MSKNSLIIDDNLMSPSLCLRCDHSHPSLLLSNITHVTQTNVHHLTSIGPFLHLIYSGSLVAAMRETAAKRAAENPGMWPPVVVPPLPELRPKKSVGDLSDAELKGKRYTAFISWLIILSRHNYLNYCRRAKIKLRIFIHFFRH